MDPTTQWVLTGLAGGGVGAIWIMLRKIDSVRDALHEHELRDATTYAPAIGFKEFRDEVLGRLDKFDEKLDREIGRVLMGRRSNDTERSGNHD